MNEGRIIIPDTNVFLNDPRSLYAFPNETIKIPLEVVEEIDDQKRRVDDVGRNARQLSRMLDELRTSRGNLADGVKLDNGCMVYVVFGEKGLNSLPASLRTNKEDNHILATALAVRDRNRDKKCVFITKDINMRIKADAIGLDTMDFEGDKIEVEELYKGFTDIEVSAETLDKFISGGLLPAEELKRALMPNEIAVLKTAGREGTAYGRLDETGTVLKALACRMDKSISGITPKNPEQLFAIDLLLDDKISLVTLNGRAGTGKTLIALAAGCHAVLECNSHEKLLVSRPVVPLGKDLGFLPGGIDEKMDPWMQPLYDNLDLIFSFSPDRKQHKRKIKDVLGEMDMIQVEPLTYIRGRSLPNQFMIIDEAQNLSPLEVKTIITRAGKNTKVVLTGDPYQIDHPYLDVNSNGLNYTVERFKNSPSAGHVTLMKGERSSLAELAAELL